MNSWIDRWLPAALRRLWTARRPQASLAPASIVARMQMPADPVLLRAQATLRHLLDRHPHSRRVFAHLALLEHGLAHLGPRMLSRQPLNSLERARRQLLTIATEAEARPLLDLLQPFTDAQAPEPPTAPTPIAPGPVEEFQTSRFGSPEIREVDATTYFEAIRAWQDTLVEDEAPPPPAVAPAEPPLLTAIAWEQTAPLPLAVAA